MFQRITFCCREPRPGTASSSVFGTINVSDQFIESNTGPLPSAIADQFSNSSQLQAQSSEDDDVHDSLETEHSVIGDLNVAQSQINLQALASQDDGLLETNDPPEDDNTTSAQNTELDHDSATSVDAITNAEIITEDIQQTSNISAIEDNTQSHLQTENNTQSEQNNSIATEEYNIVSDMDGNEFNGWKKEEEFRVGGRSARSTTGRRKGSSLRKNVSSVPEDFEGERKEIEEYKDGRFDEQKNLHTKKESAGVSNRRDSIAGREQELLSSSTANSKHPHGSKSGEHNDAHKETSRRLSVNAGKEEQPENVPEKDDKSPREASLILVGPKGAVSNICAL